MSSFKELWGYSFLIKLRIKVKGKKIKKKDCEGKKIKKRDCEGRKIKKRDCGPIHIVMLFIANAILENNKTMGISLES